MKTANAVVDGKLTNELLGQFHRRTGEILRRIESDNLSFNLVMSSLQRIVEGTSDHVVDLFRPPKIPLSGSKMVEHSSGGMGKRVLLEKPDDTLFIHGKRFVLHLTDTQKKDSTTGHNLLSKFIAGHNFLNSNVLDYLLEHPELWTEEMKQDVEGNPVYICFWNSIFRHWQSSAPCIRLMFWNNGVPGAGDRCLNLEFDSRYPAASLED